MILVVIVVMDRKEDAEEKIEHPVRVRFTSVIRRRNPEA